MEDLSPLREGVFFNKKCVYKYIDCRNRDLASARDSSVLNFFARPIKSLATPAVENWIIYMIVIN